MNIATEKLLFEDDGLIPNNPRLPARVYRGALQGPRDLEKVARELFDGNAWPAAWTNGVFSYWHYHATAHEALGVVSGEARLGLGGESGSEVDVSAGDVVLIPAGVGHKRLSASPDFSVVGAYPPGQSPDMKTGRPEEHGPALQSIAEVPDPQSDPVFGESVPDD
ncbi:MAG: cupin domain-containing protein [Rhodovibrionaceae bacterium]|nr:cupin domain-containing protein [Rhodovibrionaceae bacterium]